MKTLASLLFATILLPLASTGNVWRVNNTPGNPYDSDFTDLPNAINTAAPGDTLHLEASTVNYGNLDLDKHLVIIGPGYFLDDNHGKQASVLNAMVLRIRFLPGSEFAVISGLYVTYDDVQIQTSDVTLARNRIHSTVYFPSGALSRNNVVIMDNWIEEGISVYSTIQVPNLMITNNIILGGFNGYTGTTSGTFQYNVTGNTSNFFGMTCLYNIFRNGVTQVNDNQFSYNYFYTGHPVVPGVGNVNVAMNTVFATTPAATDSSYYLDQFSGAQTAGYNGGPIGVFGGATPYVLSGIPAIPTVYELQAPGSVIQGDAVNVVLSTRSNN